MPLEITLVRHAESLANLDTHLINGYQPLVQLSNLGVSQAQALGKKWTGEGRDFDAVWTSPALRTIKTAQYALSHIIPFRGMLLDASLRELGQWEWEWKNRTDIYTEATRKQLEESNGYFIPPGGESQDMVRQRMKSWLDGVTEKYSNSGAQKICVFSHGMAINLLREVVDLEPRNTAWKRILNNTGVSTLSQASGKWEFTSWNVTDHLDTPPSHS